MCSASLGGIAARPNIPEQPNFLESTVPETFSGWRMLNEAAQMVDPATEAILKKIYREVLSRTYVNAAGDRVMLSMARSGNQIGIQAAHIPDICYPAQGFSIGSAKDGELQTPYGSIALRRLTTSNRERHEPVTYWLTMGDQAALLDPILSVEERWPFANGRSWRG